MDINIISVNAEALNGSKINHFVHSIYVNFKELSNHPKLNHNKQEIYRLLRSPTMRGFLVWSKSKIIGYLIGETIILADGRKVFFINYVYINKMHRKKGIASTLMDKVTEYAKKLKLDNIVLICDTENTKVYEFYLKRGFMLDMTLRRYEQHDVLSMMI
jgi:ribosomal protein S18 acetylase RimI-like enzyme